jgi:hypothetical protein
MALHYVSSFSVGTLHAMINRALLRMSLSCGQPLVCHAPTSAIETLQNSVTMVDGADDVRWRCLHIPSGSSHGWMLLRYIFSAIVNVWLLLRSHRGDTIIYDFDNVMSISMIDFINRRLKRSIIVCCHGEMEYLSPDAPAHNRRLYKRLMLSLTRGYFNAHRKRVAPGLRFVVFGDAILDNLRPLLSDALRRRFSAIDHPVDAPLIAAKPCLSSPEINIATVGILNAYKGSNIYPEIARRLSDEPISFAAIGHIQCDAQPLIEVGISLPVDSSRPLSAEDFAAAIARLDFILLLYPTDTYRFIASGAMLDAVRFRRPIIALRTDYFQYIFDKFGPVGYLADDIDGLIDLLRNCRSLNRQFDFDYVARQLSVEALTPRFVALVNNLTTNN